MSIFNDSFVSVISLNCKSIGVSKYFFVFILDICLNRINVLYLFCISQNVFKIISLSSREVDGLNIKFFNI